MDARIFSTAKIRDFLAAKTVRMRTVFARESHDYRDFRICEKITVPFAKNRENCENSRNFRGNSSRKKPSDFFREEPCKFMLMNFHGEIR